MLFDAIIASHLNPLDFEYKECRNDIKINVVNKHFYFNFTSDKFHIFPFKNLYTSHEYLTMNTNFDEYIYRLNGFFKDWLRLISLEMRTEDRWESFIKKSQKLPLVDSIRFDGDKMSYVEVQKLGRNIVSAKTAFENHRIPRETYIHLYEKLTYIANKSKTIELKEDWVNLAKGILITELVQINKTLDKSDFDTLIAILRKTFEGYFRFGF